MRSAFALVLVACAHTTPETQIIHETVENAAAVAQYKLALTKCREKGKAAGSYAVYEACADAVDADLCHNSALRCEEAK